MKRFILKFKHALAFALAPDYVLDSDLPGFWTRADALSLRAYLRSDSGRKLSVILRNYTLRSATAAVNGEITTEHARGIASTVRIIDAYLPQPEHPSEELSPNSEEARAAAFMEEYGLT